MFDEMVIRTEFMKRLSEKMLERKIRKKLKKDIRIHLKELSAHTTDDEVKICVTGVIRMKLNDLEAMLEGD